MSKKFKATAGSYPSIECVDIERETDSCVWIRGRKCLKSTGYDSYFDDFYSAKNHLLGLASNRVREANSRLEYAKLGESRVLAIMEAV